MSTETARLLGQPLGVLLLWAVIVWLMVRSIRKKQTVLVVVLAILLVLSVLSQVMRMAGMA